jgi:hypothetical protein
MEGVTLRSCVTPLTLPTPSTAKFSVLKPRQNPGLKTGGVGGVALLLAGGG